MTTLYRLRFLAAIAAACALPILYVAAWLALDPRLIRFDQLEIGDQYLEAHPSVGFKVITKILPDVASAFSETCSGRQRNERVEVRGSHKVRKVSHVE